MRYRCLDTSHLIRSFGQNCAVLGAKLHGLRREQGTRGLIRILREVHDAAMGRRFRTWLMYTMSIQQLEEVSTVAQGDTNDYDRTSHDPLCVWRGTHRPDP